MDPLVGLWLVLPAVVWGLRGFDAVLRRDSGLYVYAGQLVAAGEPPYEALMNRAGPLAHLLPGLGVWLGRLVGVDDVVAVRVLFFALTALSPLVVYLLTRVTYGSRPAACVATASMLTFQTLAGLSTNGPDSKLPMVLFVALALLFTVQRRLLLAGVVAGLATLTWQPALFAIAGAGLVMGLTAPGGWRGRAGALLRFAVGGLATLAVTIGYFAAVGALEAFYDGFWLANLDYTSQPSVISRPDRVWGWLGAGFGWTRWLVVGGCVLALVLAAWVWLRRPGGGHDDPDLRHRVLALAAGTLGAVAWTLTAFDRSPDALVLLPGAAAALGGTAALLGRRLRHRRERQLLVAVVAAWVLVASALTANLTVGLRDSQLPQSADAARTVFAVLPAGATVMCDQAPQPLALAGRRSISRYVLFGNGMDGWIDATWPGGLPGYRADVERRQPTVMFTDARGFSNVLRPLRPDYRRVGRGWGWRVFVSRSVPDQTRRRLHRALAALDAVHTGGPHS